MQHSCALLFFCLFFCASAFPQNSGTIQCDPGSMTSVPAWVVPGLPQVVEQLSCGQMVSVLGIERTFAVLTYSSHPREFVKIKIAEKVAYVDAKYVLLSGTQERLKVNKGNNVAAEKQSAKEEAEQKKWNLITKDNVKLRDEMLLNPIVINGPRTFAATISNDSEFPVSQLHLLVRLYDCSGKPQSDYANCEIIGEVKPVIPASIPSGQTRSVSASMLFEATPRVKGTCAWGYWILGVRVE